MQCVINMKAVIYHADGKRSEQFPKDTYKNLILGLKENCNSFGIPLIHLTINGFEGLGDENYYYDGNPDEIIYNREKFFIEFLKSAPDDEYWFTEPDSRIVNMFPPLTGDVAMLLRSSERRLNAAWRLAKKSAVPFFEEAFSYYDLSRKDWDGDTTGYVKIWERIGEPTEEGLINYNNMSIELRNFKQYCYGKGYYTRQWKSWHKVGLVEVENNLEK